MLQAKRKNLNHIYIKAKQELAYTKSLTELYQTSLTDMQEAFVEAFALDDQLLLGLINETYGAIYGYMQQYDKSIEYYEKALDTYSQLGYKAHIAEATYGLASTYRYWKKFKIASDKFRLYQRQISYTPNTDLSFFAAYGLGMTLAEQGECAEALIVIEKAFTLKGFKDYEAELYKRKASCLITLNKLVEAEAALTQANNIFVSLPELVGTHWQLETMKISAELAYAKDDHQQGYQLLSSYYQQYSELLTKRSNVKIATVRASMEKDRAAMEKVLFSLRSDIELLQNRNRHQVNYLYISIVLIFLLAIVGIVFHKKSK